MTGKLHQRLDREAAELWQRPRAEVRDQLICHYLPFAEQLAQKKSSKNRRVDPADVLQEALIALVKSVDDFDPHNEAGASFTTFAGWRIRGQVVEAERANDWVSHKVRAEFKDTLPRMGHFADGMGEQRPGTDDDRHLEELPAVVAAVLSQCPPVTASVLRKFLAAGSDLNALAASMSCAVEQAAVIVRSAIASCQTHAKVDSEVIGRVFASVDEEQAPVQVRAREPAEYSLSSAPTMAL